MLAFALQISLGASAQSPGNNPPTPAPTPCDYNYWESLKSRAWLEAQREITQNQNLIFKPDSVMEYTCFDQFLNVLAKHAKNMFSETDRWGSVSGIVTVGVDPTSMDRALQILTGEALINWIQTNFWHTFLGGRIVNLDYMPGPVRPGEYHCDRMAEAWHAAKCMDFIPFPDEDGFFTFTQYRDDPDKRWLPIRCAAISARWDAEMRKAPVEPYANVDLYTLWIEDNVITYLNLLDPANCSSTPPLPTGIIVQRPKQSPADFPEHACLPPGCHYSPSQRRCQ